MGAPMRSKAWRWKGVGSLICACCASSASSPGSSAPTATSSPPNGTRAMIFYTMLHNRLLQPLLAADQPQTPNQLRAALRAIDQHIDDYIHRARITPAA